MNFIIIEDHELVRDGVVKIIEEKSGYSCAGKYSCIDDAVEFVKSFSKRSEKLICLVDINLGEEDGLDFIRICKEKYPNVRCIVYTMYSGAGIIKQAMEAGAKAFISKNAEISELITAFNCVVADEMFYLEAALNRSYIVFSTMVSSLTKRELEVFDMLIKKVPSKEIAKKMQISVRTAENYFSRIYDKLSVSDKDELVKKFG